MGVTNTTPVALQALIVSTVEGITPSATRGATRDRWRNRKSNKRGPVSNNTRLFHVEMFGDRMAPAPMAGWTTGSEVREVSVIVVTDYSIPQQHAYPVIAMDNADIRDALSDLHLNSANGIWLVEDDTFTDPPEDTEGPFQIAHEFTVTYQRARTYGA